MIIQSELKKSVCPLGSYCPPGSTTPEPCDAGTYGDSTGFRSSFECVKCNPGTYCPDRGMTATGSNCTAGYYCKSGSKSKNPRDGITGNICPKGAYCVAGVSDPAPCTSGKTTLFEGATAESDCKPCYPGYYCPNIADTSDVSIAEALQRLPCDKGKYCPSESGEGIACPVGHYCPQDTLSDGSIIGSVFPRPCEQGTFSSEKNRDLCEECTAGNFCPLPGMENGFTCPKGYYCPTGSKKPTACSSGFYNPSEGSTSVADCRTCDIGKYCDSHGMSEGSAYRLRILYCLIFFEYRLFVNLISESNKERIAPKVTIALKRALIIP